MTKNDWCAFCMGDGEVTVRVVEFADGEKCELDEREQELCKTTCPKCKGEGTNGG